MEIAVQQQTIRCNRGLPTRLQVVFPNTCMSLAAINRQLGCLLQQSNPSGPSSTNHIQPPPRLHPTISEPYFNHVQIIGTIHFHVLDFIKFSQVNLILLYRLQKYSSGHFIYYNQLYKYPESSTKQTLKQTSIYNSSSKSISSLFIILFHHVNLNMKESSTNFVLQEHGKIRFVSIQNSVHCQPQNAFGLVCFSSNFCGCGLKKVSF